MSQAAAPSAVTPDEKIFDFPDWVNPTLVKEIRQGLRANILVLTFIAQHVLLFFWTFFMMLQQDGLRRSSDGEGFYWLILGVGCMLLSLSSIGAVRSERNAGTFELQQLACQNTWSIVLGKWMAMTARLFLFLVSLLPYMVLRYFLGTFELEWDFSILGICVMASMFFMAMSLFISTFGSRDKIVATGLAYLVNFAGTATVVSLACAAIAAHDKMFDSLLQAVSFVTATLLAVACFLCLTATRIAPASENTTTRTRLVGLCFGVLAVAEMLYLLPNRSGEMPFVSIAFYLMLALLIVDALAGATSPSLPTYKAFGRRGLPGRLFALLFAPSRGAGMLYGILIFALWSVPLFVQKAEVGIRASLLPMEGFFGTALLAYLARRTPLGHWNFGIRFVALLVLQAVLIVLCWIGSGVETSLTGGQTVSNYIAMLTPFGATIVENSARIFGMRFEHALAGYMTVGWLLIALGLTRYILRDLRAVMKMSRGERVKIPPA